MIKKTLRKLISGGDSRLTRFHTEKNVFVGWKNLFSQVPIVCGQKIRNRLVGSRPIVPWWPLPAVEEVNKILHPGMVAVEFGSGSSTIWIARRVKSVVAREHDAKWAAITKKRIAAEGLLNCEVQHRQGDAYYGFAAGERFDFAVVDGEFRWKCIEELAGRMNPGGFIYFDNSDSDKDSKHYREFGLSTDDNLALEVVESLKQCGKITVEELHGMINGEAYAGSGMLIKF